MNLSNAMKPATKASTSEVLAFVLFLINKQGYEFPDAIYKASTKYRLTSKQVSALESAYDAQ